MMRDDHQKLVSSGIFRSNLELKRNEFAAAGESRLPYANISNCIREAVSYDGAIEYS